MAQSRQSISSLTSGSDIIAKISNDANLKQLCASNKAVYRLESFAAGQGVTTLTNVIPLDPPCSYFIRATWVAWDSLVYTPVSPPDPAGPPYNPVIVIVQLNSIEQVSAGGAIVQLPPITQKSTSPIASTSTIAYAKNPSIDALDVIINISAPGSAAQIFQNIEFEVFCDKLF